MRNPRATATSPTSAPTDETASSHEWRASAWERCRLDLVPDPALGAGHRLVAGDPYHRAENAGTEVAGRAVSDQFAIALHRGEHCAGPDDQRHPQPGEVLGTLVAVGVTGGGFPLGHREAEEHDCAGRHVGQVVQGVGQQAYRSTEQGQEQFDAAGECQPHRREAHRMLADPTRLRILWALFAGEQSVGGLAELVGVTPLIVSQHLAKLRLGRVVTTRRERTRGVLRRR